MNNIALVTVLFDYPDYFPPSFYNNAKKYFQEKDIHVVRKSNLVKDGSYYDKLYYYKVVSVLEYIKENLQGKYEYILFLDATDTNFLKPPTDIVEKFSELNCSLIMGAEKGLWPPTNYVHLYEKKQTSGENKYLNSGTYFGLTERIIFHLTDIIEKEYQTGIDDQGRWTIQYLLNDDIIIDYENNFFFSTYENKDRVKITEDGVIISNSKAFIIHDNGPHTDNTIKLTDILK